MILRMIWPWWLLLAILGPVLLMCTWQLIRGSRGRRLSWVRRIGMIICLAAIGLTPSIESKGSQALTSNAELYFVVDRTGSMAAEDYDNGQARLIGVQADLKALTDAMPGARYSIVSFESQATRQLPLTTDARAVKAWADTVNQEITQYSAGSSVTRPVDRLLTTLTNAAENNPQNVRLLFIFSDGEDTEGDGGTESANEYGTLAGLIDGGGVLGYGTETGANMRMFDGSEDTGFGTEAEYIIDPATGEPAVSRLDEMALRGVAAELGVPYMHRNQPGGVESLVSGINVDEIASDGRRTELRYDDVYWPFALALALLLAWEAWVLLQQVPRVKVAKTPRVRKSASSKKTAEAAVKAGVTHAPPMVPFPQDSNIPGGPPHVAGTPNDPNAQEVRR